MPKSIQEIQSDPNFQTLPQLEQGKVIDTILSQDPKFLALPEQEQAKVKNMIRPSVSNEQLLSKLQDIKKEKLKGQVTGRFQAAPQLEKGYDIAEQNLYNQLSEQGLDPNSANFALQVMGKIKQPRYGRMAGGITGGIVGPFLLGQIPPFTFLPEELLTIPLTAAIGAGTLGTAGETIQTGIEEKRLISRREALKAFSTEVAFEAGGRYAVMGGKFIFSPFIKKIVPEAASLIDDYSKVGGQFSPSELDKRFSVRIAEGASRGSFGARDIWEEFEKKQANTARIYADNIIDSIADGVARETPSAIGEELAGDITRPGGRILKIFDDLVTPLYKQVDDLTKVATVSPVKIKIFAKQQLALDKRLNGLYLSPSGRTEISKILDLPDRISFSDMRQLRSSFLGEVRKMARDTDKAQGIIKKISQLTDDALFDPAASKNLSPEALNLLKNTNKLYAAGKEGLKTTFSERLAKRLIANPSKVVAEAIPNKNPTAIMAMRKSLTEPISGRPSEEGKILWNKLRQAWLADVVDNSVSPEGIIKRNAFDNRLTRFGGEKALKELFPEPDKVAQVYKVRDLFRAVSSKPPSEPSLFIRGGQVGGVVMMYKGIIEGDALSFGVGGTLVFGPIAFAKLATHPIGVKLITLGFKVKPGSSELVPLAARMVNLLNQINRKEQKQSKLRRQKEFIERYQKRQIELYKPMPPLPPTMAEKERIIVERNMLQNN